MTEFGGSIDPFEVDFFFGSGAGLLEKRFAKSDDTLAGTGNTTLDHEEVLGDNTILRETTERGDVLLGGIEVGGGVVGGESADVLSIIGGALADTVDLLVDFNTVMITVLTSTSNGPGDVSWMPSTNTGDLAETLVRLARKTGSTPTSGDTLESLTLSNGDGVDHFVLSKDSINRDGLLEQVLGKGNLVGDGTSVDLDFTHVSLLLAQVEATDLGVADDTDDCAVLDDASKFGFDLLASTFSGSSLGIFGECLPLAAVPVLVEATETLFRQMFGPNGGHAAKTSRGFDVSNDSNSDHGRSFNDGDGFNDFLLVRFGTRVVDYTDNVSHTSFVAHEGSQMSGL